MNRRTPFYRLIILVPWLLFSVIIVFPMIVVLAVGSALWNLLIKRRNIAYMNWFNRNTIRLWHWNKGNTSWVIVDGPGDEFEVLP